MPRTINLIVIHCSATQSGKPLQQGKPGDVGYLNAPKVINAWHAARGFKRQSAAVAQFNPHLPSIGYHFVVDLSGEVFTGRHIDEIGAHAQDFNANSIGICLIGGIERDGQYTQAQWRSLATIVRMAGLDHGIQMRAPTKALLPTGKWTATNGVCGHRDLSPDKNGNGLVEPFEWLKTCPGFNVTDWITSGLSPEPKHVFKEA